MGTLKKVKELKVLDGKSAQNISILLNGSLKHMAYDDIKKCLLRCDETVLTENVLEQLIQVSLKNIASGGHAFRDDNTTNRSVLVGQTYLYNFIVLTTSGSTEQSTKVQRLLQPTDRCRTVLR